MKTTTMTLALAFFLAWNDGAARAEEEGIRLTFGVYTSDKPTDMYKAFKPILLCLEASLKEALAKPVFIKLRVFNSYDAARKALTAGEVDFVRFGPSTYILSKQDNPGVSILAIEEQEGQHVFNGVIFTRGDTGINSVKDLKGKAFAFGDKDSTIGRYLSQSFLVDAKIYAKDLAKFEYLERHDRVVEAVLSGKYDAGAVKEGTLLKYKDKGLKVLETFQNTTKPWVARSGLSPEVTEAIKKGLAGLKDKKALDAIGEKVTGFNLEHAKDEIYDDVRLGMKKSEEFEKGTSAPGTSDQEAN